MVTRVHLAEVRVDPDIWPRLGLLAERVEYLAGLYRAYPDLLPPIEVVRDGDELLVADGHHRLAALRAIGATDVEVHVLDLDDGRSPRARAVVHAVWVSGSSSLPLAAAERRRAYDLMRAMCPDMSITDAARLSGYSREGASRRSTRMARAAENHQARPERPDPVAEVAAQLARTAIRLRRVARDLDPVALERVIARKLEAEAGDSVALADWVVDRVTGARDLLGEASVRDTVAGDAISAACPGAHDGCPAGVRDAVVARLRSGAVGPGSVITTVLLGASEALQPVGADDPRLARLMVGRHPDWQPLIARQLAEIDHAASLVAGLIAIGEVAWDGERLALTPVAEDDQ